MRLLDKVNRVGTTILMATHDQAIVDAMPGRVIEREATSCATRPVGCTPDGEDRSTSSARPPRDSDGTASWRSPRCRRRSSRCSCSGSPCLIAREFSLVTTQLTGNVEVQVYLSDPVNRDTVGRLSDRLLEVGVSSVEYWIARGRASTSSCSRTSRSSPRTPCSVIPTSCCGCTWRRSTVSPRWQRCSGEGRRRGRRHAECPEPGSRSTCTTEAPRPPRLDHAGPVAQRLRDRGDHARLGRRPGGQHVADGDVRPTQGDRDRALVGATNWRIRVPFLIEGLVEVLIGAFFALAASSSERSSSWTASAAPRRGCR